MTNQSCIVIDPQILVGKPVIRGTRLSVEFIIGLMADGWSEADILSNYPGITQEDIFAPDYPVVSVSPWIVDIVARIGALTHGEWRRWHATRCSFRKA